MKNRDYYFAGAAFTALSTVAFTFFAFKKAKKEKAYASLLLAGVAGLAVGAMLASKPTRIATDHLAAEDLLDDADTDLMQANISEVLGNAADRGTAPQKLRQIELDEEATIEDFM